MQLIYIKRYDGALDAVKVYNVKDFPYERIDRKRKLLVHKKKNLFSYYNAFSTFDIETTTIENCETPYGFMYHWQMVVDGIACIGRTWEEWTSFILKLQNVLGFDYTNRFVCYVHNLGFEYEFCYEFLNKYFDGFEVFANKQRKPMRVICGNGLELRCSYFLTNMSLAKATKNELGVIHIKAENDLDYRKIRTHKSRLTPTEIAYCVSDVVSLYELIWCKLKNEHDDLESIPMTSTGYVRRDCRRACRKEPRYRDNIFKKQTMSEDVYQMLKECGRGGNTHCNRRWAGHMAELEKHGEIYSFDFASSYPAQQLLYKFPASRFVPYGDIESAEEFNELLSKYACLFTVQFENIELKDNVSMPYIPTAKCLSIVGGRFDNGRVLFAKSLTLTVTDIDWKIIIGQYRYSKKYVGKMHIAKYDYLPKPLREQIMLYFEKKCVLKEQIQELEENGDFESETYKDLQYNYGKMKNRLNGIFGMSYTDPVRDQLQVTSTGEWKIEKTDIPQALKKYFNSRNSFLIYAWGVWTTARARAHLERLINITDKGVINTTGEADGTYYCDTDSSKCINPNFDEIEKFNAEIRALCEERGAFVDVKEKRYYLGVAECENEHDPIKRFISLGAKKYAYEDSHGLHLTVSGVAKKAGAKELEKIENFRIGFIFNKAGGQTLYYNDNVGIHTETINGVSFTTASNIGIIDSTYTIGITDEYAELIGIEETIIDI